MAGPSGLHPGPPGCIAAGARHPAWARFSSVAEDGCTPRTAAALVLALEGAQLAPKKDRERLFSRSEDQAGRTSLAPRPEVRLPVLGRLRQVSLAGAHRAAAGRIATRGGLYTASVFLRGGVLPKPTRTALKPWPGRRSCRRSHKEGAHGLCHGREEGYRALPSPIVRSASPSWLRSKSPIPSSTSMAMR